MNQFLHINKFIKKKFMTCFLDSSNIRSIRALLKTFSNFFFKNKLKIIPYYIDFCVYSIILINEVKDT